MGAYLRAWRLGVACWPPPEAHRRLECIVGRPIFDAPLYRSNGGCDLDKADQSRSLSILGLKLAWFGACIAELWQMP
jgi:hypothetical protein